MSVLISEGFYARMDDRVGTHSRELFRRGKEFVKFSNRGGNDMSEGAGVGRGKAAVEAGIETQKSISDWAVETFGATGSNLRVALRMNNEMAELLDKLAKNDTDPNAVEEAGDIIIVAMRLFERFGVNFWDVVEAKMLVNRARKWKKDGTGCGQHVGWREQLQGAPKDQSDFESHVRRCSYWWCENCEQVCSPSDVTFEERHTLCGEKVYVHRTEPATPAQGSANKGENYASRNLCLSILR